MKKLVSFILTIVMVATICCMPVSAASYKKVAEKTVQLGCNEAGTLSISAVKGEKFRLEITQIGKMSYVMEEFIGAYYVGGNKKVKLAVSTNDSNGKNWLYGKFSSTNSTTKSYNLVCVVTDNNHVITLKNITDVPNGVKIGTEPKFTIKLYKDMSTSKTNSNSVSSSSLKSSSNNKTYSSSSSSNKNYSSTSSSSKNISWPTVKNIKTYVISTQNNTTVYKSETSNAKYGTIYATDLITIKGYSGSRLKVTYPVKGGTKTGYIDKSKVTSATINKATAKKTASSKITAYRRSSGSDQIGYISSGDVYYEIATKNGRKQVIYPVEAGGYKMGWIK